MIGAQTIDRFLASLASDSPTPGGGAVAALAGAAGAALIEMVCNLTIDKKNYEDAWGRMRELRGHAERTRSELVTLADRDTTAFDGVMEAFRMPKDTDEQRAVRAAAIQRGYLTAAQVPLLIARASVSLMPLALETVERGNVNAASDGVSAAQMLFAGTECARSTRPRSRTRRRPARSRMTSQHCKGGPRSCSPRRTPRSRRASRRSHACDAFERASPSSSGRCGGAGSGRPDR